MIFADAPAFNNIVPITLILFFAGTIFFEAWILSLFKYKPFQNSLKDSAIVNISSLVISGIIIYFYPGEMESLSIAEQVAMVLITIAIEALILTFLNKEWTFKNTILASIVMNAASYTGLVLLIMALNYL